MARHDGPPLGGRGGGGPLEHVLRPSRPTAEVGEPLAGAPDAEAHVGAPDRVDRQLDVELRRVERTEKATQWPCQRQPRLVVEIGFGELLPRHHRPAEEGPRELGVRLADEERLWDRQRQQRREPRQHRQLPREAVQGNLAPRETEQPRSVDEPCGVVPALAGEMELSRIELRELRRQEPPRERLVNDDLRAPLRHGATLTIRWAVTTMAAWNDSRHPLKRGTRRCSTRSPISSSACGRTAPTSRLAATHPSSPIPRSMWSARRCTTCSPTTSQTA